MKKIDIFKRALVGDYIGYSTFIYSIFTKVTSDTDYIQKIVTGKDKHRYTFTLGDEVFDIDDYNGDGPLFTIDDVITVTPDDLSIITKPVTTTVWIVILNYMLLYIPTKGKIKFRTDNLDIKHIETVTLPMLYQDGVGIADAIKTLSISVSYLRQFADFIIVPATEKTLTPPPDLDIVKKKIIKELTVKYGESPLNSKIGTFEFESKLIDHYKEYMKDDPTYGIITSGKMINVVGKKRFLTIGHEGGFETGEEVNIGESLTDGYPKDRKKLATIFNTGRAGSFFRGFETRDAGTTSKELLDATSGIYVDVDDCGVTYGHVILITKKNTNLLKDRYILANGKTVHVGNPKKYIGKLVTLRSPRYCKAKGGSICKLCVSKSSGRYKEAPTILALSLGGALLDGKLAKTHGVSNNLREYTIDDMFN